MKTISQTAVERACAIIGSQALLAGRLGVTPSVVNQWIKGLRPVPTKHCPTIESMTEGAVRCEELHPNFDWAFLRASQPATATRANASPAPDDDTPPSRDNLMGFGTNRPPT